MENKEEENICDICCDKHNNESIILKCKHKFHYFCVLRSFIESKSTQCPYCRLDGGILKYNKNYGEIIIGIHCID